MTQKRPTKRIRNPEVTRAKLLDATIELVAEKGADSLSLLEAARHAKVSRGIAYHHFEDRDHLFREAMSLVAHRLKEGANRRKGESLHDRVLHSTKFVFENPEICKLLMVEAIAGRDLDRRHPMVKFDMKMLRDLISRGRARANLDAEIVTYISIGTIATALMLREQYKGSDLDALAERFSNEWARILRSGIFAEGLDVEAAIVEKSPSRPVRAKSVRRK